MKTPDQLVDELTGQIDELLRLLGAIRDEASLRETKPKIAAQIAKINDTLSMAFTPGISLQPMNPEKAKQLQAKQQQMQQQAAAEGRRIGAIPGAGNRRRTDEDRAGPRCADDAEGARCPGAGRIAAGGAGQVVHAKKGPSHVFAVVFEGLPPGDLPRIDQRLRSLGMHDGPSVSTGDRCLKYVSPVIKPELLVGVLNVGEAG